MSTRIVVVAGPTASGKSALALALAERLGGEVIGADSRQLYAGLPVASAGPDDVERARAPHHLYESFPPATTLSAGAFLVAADAAIAGVLARGRVAIVVGGTGLYLRALRTGLDEALPSDSTLRVRLDDDLRAHGLPALVERLRSMDPRAAERIDLQNPVRVTRALELAMLGVDAGARDVDALLARAPREIVRDARWLLIDIDTERLAHRIDERTRRMFSSRAVVDEALGLAGALPADHPLLRTIGVEEALDLGRGRCSIDDAITRVSARTRQYARRQRTWFRKEPWWERVPQHDHEAAFADTVLEVLGALSGRDERR